MSIGLWKFAPEAVLAWCLTSILGKRRENESFDTYYAPFEQ